MPFSHYMHAIQPLHACHSAITCMPFSHYMHAIQPLHAIQPVRIKSAKISWFKAFYEKYRAKQEYDNTLLIGMEK